MEKFRPDPPVSALLLLVNILELTMDEPQLQQTSVKACQLAVGIPEVIISLYLCSLWVWSEAGMCAQKQGGADSLVTCRAG